jgi:uncharacterized protein (TIGR03437 family)
MAATFGTGVPVVGGVADLVLDEGRNRLYLINTNRNQIEVFATNQRRFLNPIPVEGMPLAGAISRNGRVLYVTAHEAGALLVIDLETMQVISRVSLPARPEGVAVGGDERVLISTVGTGQGNANNVLLIYDPFVSPGQQPLIAVTTAPPPPANPLLPPQNLGRPAVTSRSYLQTSADGRFIIGVNIPNAANRAVFVFEVASGTVLRSRTVAGVSSVLSVAPDGSKFMAGLTLFDTETLTVLAQQNATNAPYPFPTGTNFNLQQNQGGSVFSPDGSRIYSAFNFAAVQTTARPNASQLMISDSDNLLIADALQLPESLAGKMVLSSDGSGAYAISDSGFLILPLGTMNQLPIARVQRTVTLLANDQCGVTADRRVSRLEVVNEGRGRLTATAQLLQLVNTGPGGLGGNTGPGGALPGGGVVIPLPVPPTRPEEPIPIPPTLPGGQPTGQNAAIAATAPRTRFLPTAEGTSLEFTYNTSVRSMGTVSPVHQFIVQSNEAINIPAAVQVYQNNRNTEARGDIMPVEVGLSANAGLLDMVQDTRRARLYIANSALNRVEVFDARARSFLAPIKVGQLPVSLAMSPDGQTLYVANNGGESISVIDLESQSVVGRVLFPATPFNANVALITPQVVAAGLRGPLVMMSNGTLWRIVGNEAVPRRFSTAVLPPTGAQQTQIVTAPRTMASSPGGEFLLVLGGNNMAYLYDAVADDFIQARQVIPAAPVPAGYYGPITVGPGGQYFAVNGYLLNQSLVEITSVPTGTRRIAALTAVGAGNFARFSQPVLANAAAVGTNTDQGTIEVVNSSTGAVLRSAPALERPVSIPTGNVRANVPGRMMAIDPSGTVAYVLTQSGLSIVPMEAPPVTNRPAINPNGTVSIASYLPQMAPGGLISIFGRNFGADAVATETPLPTVLGGACVTVNDRPIPLFMTSPIQINAQIPPDLAPGRYNLMVRSVDQLTASTSQSINVTRYAPAVFVDPPTKIAAILHPDGAPVTRDRPARRDRRLMLYATGLGVTQGGSVGAGRPAPTDPLAETQTVEVFFGDPTFNGSEMVVEWSGLVPGFIGLYQINLYVPGNRMRGDALPVTVRIGGVSSPNTGPVPPVVAVE